MFLSMAQDMEVQELYEFLQEHMLTKEEAHGFASKDDLLEVKESLKAFATKDDLKAFATKDDLKAFATREDLQGVREDIKLEMNARFREVDRRFDGVDASLGRLEKKTQEDDGAIVQSMQKLEKRVGVLEQFHA